MSIFHNNALIGAGGQGGATSAYQISRSLRFNSADSAYLTRTPSATSTSSTTCTLSFWTKRCSVADNRPLSLGPGSGVVNTTIIQFLSSGSIGAYFISTGAYSQFTTSVLRDPSAWYHIVFRIDTTQATDTNRCRIYVNGVQQTGLTGTAPPQNHAMNWGNSGQANWIGGDTISGQHYNGYLADIHFIDGQSLDPTSFGEFDTNGVWQPKAYTGTYGTNGFHLDFADNSAATAAALGKDTSGNGNNWTPTNFSVTAGAGNDSLVDSPTNYGTDTGAGGEVKGNYATLNILSQSGSNTISNGNLDATIASGTSNTIVATTGLTSGKWYWEVTPTALSTAAGMIGVGDLSVLPSSRNYQGSGWYYVSDGTKYNSSTNTSYGASYAANDVIGVALDMDSGTLSFYKNGAAQGTAYSTGLSGKTLAPILGNGTNGSSQSYVCNFGQRPFAYAAPSGYKALCTQNLPTPTIPNGRTAMDVATYTGNGSTQNITGLSFSPDLVWLKSRSGTTDHTLYDVIRGAQSRLESNTTDGEVTSDSGLTAFNSDGFSLGSLAQVNTNSATYVAWAWDAGATASSNTQGSITSQVRANLNAGISIVSYTGNGSSGATVGHGLGVAPPIVIAKSRNNVDSWVVYTNLVDGSSDYLLLNTTGAKVDSSHSAPTSTVFNPSITVGPSINCIAYCFAPVAGFSAFGRYTGNGSTDGTFVYLGFRPRWVMIKRTDDVESWFILDTARNPGNVANLRLIPNLTNGDTTVTSIDILSNGFKLRTATAGEGNNNGASYIYAAFAENPFSTARAR